MSNQIDELLARDERPQKRTCENHGDYSARNLFGDIWTRCPGCAADDDAKKRALLEREQAMHAERIRERRLRDCGIPPEAVEQTFENFERDEHNGRALERMVRYADELNHMSGQALILSGNAGAGKTHLAQAAVRRAIERGYSARYTTCVDMITEKMFGWKDGLTPRGFAARYGADLLVIDELDDRLTRDGWRLEFFDIIDEAYRRRRNILLVSNSGVEDIKRYIGERVYDRLRDMSAAVLRFDWASRRGLRENEP